MTRTQERTLKAINNYKARSNRDNKRLEKAIELFNNDLERHNSDSGLYGKVIELFSHDSNSTIIRVQAQNRNDNYIIVNGKRKACEVKTNGGRIGNLYNMSMRTRKTNYIIYHLNYDTPIGKPRKDGTRKPSEHREACKVMTVQQFIELVENCKATKIIGHNETDREVAVQGDSKKLYEALTSGKYLDYLRGFEYIAEDFE